MMPYGQTTPRRLLLPRSPAGMLPTVGTALVVALPLDKLFVGVGGEGAGLGQGLWDGDVLGVVPFR